MDKNMDIQIGYSKLGLAVTDIEKFTGLTEYRLRPILSGLEKGNCLPVIGVDYDEVAKITGASMEIVKYAVDIFKTKYSITYDTLYDYYINKKKTYNDIANEFNVTRQRVSRVMSAYGIDKLGEKQKVGIELNNNIDDIVSMYENGLSLHNIARVYNVDVSRVRYMILNNKGMTKNIKKKLLYTHYTEYENKESLSDIEKLNSIAIKMHIEDGMTIKDIGEKLSIKPNTLFSRLAKCGFLDSEDYRGRNNSSIDKEILEELYLDRLYCINQIADILNVTYTTIKKAIDVYKLPKRKIVNRLKVVDIAILIEFGISEDILKRDFMCTFKSYEYFISHNVDANEKAEKTKERVKEFKKGNTDIDLTTKNNIVRLINKYDLARGEH